MGYNVYMGQHLSNKYFSLKLCLQLKALRGFDKFLNSRKYIHQIFFKGTFFYSWKGIKYKTKGAKVDMQPKKPIPFLSANSDAILVADL